MEVIELTDDGKLTLDMDQKERNIFLKCFEDECKEKDTYLSEDEKLSWAINKALLTQLKRMTKDETGKTDRKKKSSKAKKDS